MDPLVSVIIPVYNAEAFLEQCVTSVTGQTYQNLEILLIDDGSTDGSPALCDGFRAGDPRIMVIHKENGGASEARRTGAEASRGEYLMFVDSDDWIDPDTVAACVQAAGAEDARCVLFSYVKEYGTEHREVLPVIEGSVYRRLFGPCGRELRYPEQLNYLSSCCMKLYGRECVEQAGYFDPALYANAEDLLFNVHALAGVRRLHCLDRCCYHYRRTNEASLTSRYRGSYPQDVFSVYDYLLQFVQAHDLGGDYAEAVRNRVVLNVMSVVLNELQCPSRATALRQIRAYLRAPLFRSACAGIPRGALSFPWRIVVMLCRMRSALGLYVLFSLVKKIKR